jgi:succinate-semialdehyde dehydrogenase/glutarate-semialdehyde dehydrogenase
MTISTFQDFGDARQALNLSRPDLLRTQGYIDGEWVDGLDVLDVINPATGKRLGVVADLDDEAAEAAVAAAHAALPAWSARTAKDRAVILRRWFDLMCAHAWDLARLLTAEQGKPLSEAHGEVLYAASFIEWFAEEGKRAYGEVIPGHQQDKRLFVLRQPVGVVAAVTPWNFPAAMITRKAGPALAAGCTMVLKPSDLTPYTALALAVLGEEAGLPKGVFNVVPGQAEPIGRVLTGDPRVRKFTFTGSTAVGKMLAARCAQTVKSVSLELGGNAPFIVFADADLEQAVTGALASKYRNSGQTCVCANRFLVHRDVLEPFVAALRARIEGFVLGDGLKVDAQQGPLINPAAVDKVRRHVADALAKGASLVTGGEPPEGDGYFFQPTILTGVTADMLVCREETFGPVAGIMAFDTEAQAIALANDSAAGLAAYLYTRDLGRAWRVTEALEYGIVGLNTGIISTEVAPFGGIKESGIGREGSRHGLDEYLETKFVCMAVPAAGASA